MSEHSNTILHLLRQAQKFLPINYGSLDTEILLAHCIQKPRTFIKAFPEYNLSSEVCKFFLQLIERRARGEPVAYLIGKREFWSLSLQVTPTTLVPRPETECIVELALQYLNDNQASTVADLGTGCGAIAIAIATERPNCNIIATDISDSALAIARANAAHFGLTNIQFYQGSWCHALPLKAIAMIVCNPPYIAANDPHLLSDGLSYEPRLALTDNDNGLTALQQVIQQATDYLQPQGTLILEHGWDQGRDVMALLQQWNYKNCVQHTDYAGLNRAVTAQYDALTKLQIKHTHQH